MLKGGYEIANCEYSFQQGFDDKSKAQTEVFGGTIHLVLTMFPDEELILLQNRIGI